MSQATATAWIVGVVLMSPGAGLGGQDPRPSVSKIVLQGCLALAPPSQPSPREPGGSDTPQTFLLEPTSSLEQTRPFEAATRPE